MTISEAMDIVRKRKEPLMGLQFLKGTTRFFYRSVVVEFGPGIAIARER